MINLRVKYSVLHFEPPIFRGTPVLSKNILPPLSQPIFKMLDPSPSVNWGREGAPTAMEFPHHNFMLLFLQYDHLRVITIQLPRMNQFANLHNLKFSFVFVAHTT